MGCAPYARGLLAALPTLDDIDAPLTPIPGDIPSPLERPRGCVYNTRCQEVLGVRCSAEISLISAQGLSVHFALRGNLIGPTPFVRAVENVSLESAPGSFFGLVGESGSGKTTLGRAMLRAVPISKGDVLFDDGEVKYSLKELGKKELKDCRKRAQLIFQDP